MIDVEEGCFSMSYASASMCPDIVNIYGCTMFADASCKGRILTISLLLAYQKGALP